jgi:MFS family permease
VKPSATATTGDPQRRAVRTLSASQVLTGIGVGSGVAAGSLIVAEVSGSDGLAGLAQTTGVVGAAVAAVPLARLSVRHGRRHGLTVGLALAAAGAGIVILGAATELLVVILFGTFLVGIASAVGLQARYAATDLASPEHVGRDLSIVVWATTIGAVLGPNLMEPAAILVEPTGLPRLSGAYILSAAALALSAVLIYSGLRPDPLLLARATRGHQEDAQQHVRLRTALGKVRASADATLGLSALVLGHCVMVMVMVMTPVHMQHVDVTLQIVGLVISVHILGMFAFSPIVGTITDRKGPKAVIATGMAILASATLLAGTAPGDAVWQLGIGLFLLGLGWSCTLVAGSALLTESVSESDRPGVQGAGDTVMNIAAAVGGGLAGVVVAVGSYGWLNLLAAALIVPVAVLSIRRRVPA